jgi:hypothetical protein
VARVVAAPAAKRTVRLPWALPAVSIATPLALGAYLAYALFVTWPWITDPGGTLFGLIGGDLTSGVATFQQLAEERQPPFFPGTVMQLNAPEGVPTDWAVHAAAFGSSATLWLLSIAIGSIAAHGVVAVLGFALSAFSMFLLARTVTGSAGVGFVVGLAYGFWPFTYGTGWTWPHYIHLWVFVLLVWRMLVVTEKPTLRNGALAGGAGVVAMTWIQYNLLIAGVAYAVLAAIALARAAVRSELGRQVRAQAVASAMVATVAVVVFSAVTATGNQGVPTRTAEQAVTGSARLEMYGVPGPRHPLFGDRTGPWLFKRFAGPVGGKPNQAIYADIYLGVPLLLLAFAGAVWTAATVLRRRRQSLEAGLAAVGTTALVLGVVALAFSGPPRVTLFGVVIPMPYAFVEEVTTVFRVAHRFAVLVMLAVCLLAAVALARVLQGRALAVRAGVLALVALAFVVDLRAQPSPATAKVRPPAIYQLLDRKLPGIVAEYPLNAASTVASIESLNQEAHEHDLFAGAPTESEAESRKLELGFLLAERTVPDLAAYGVAYVLVHHPDPAQPPRPGQPIRGLRLIGGDRAATLYGVAAPPSTFTSYGLRGFYLTEGQSPGMRWMRANGAELELLGRCDPCVGVVSFTSSSFAVPRMLTIQDEGGRTVFSGRIDPEGDRIRFRIRFSRRTVLRLSTNPPPTPINTIVSGPDARTVSITLVQPVRFVPDVRH